MRSGQKQVDAYIKAHLNTVSDRQMEVYVSYFREGKSVGETATKLGLSTNAVTHAIARLRKNSQKDRGSRTNP